MNKKLDKKGIDVAVTISAGELIEQIFWGLTETEAVDFIKGLDDYFASYSFSEPLYKYFKKQHKQLRKEEKEARREGF